MGALSEQTIKTVKATAPVVAEHGTAITTTFYGIMFSSHPEVRTFFNMKHQKAGEVGAQPKALASAVYAYAAHIDDLGALTGAVKRIAHKHASLMVMPEHYPVVGSCLLKAIKRVLGDAATPEIMDAWAEAYGFLADIFIDAEKNIKAENEKKAGGFMGFKDFVVDKKVKESDNVTSFYFSPVGGGPVPSYEPGQYLSFLVPLADGEVRRNYSISDAQSEGSYRVSIKKIEGGAVSTWFHDQVSEGSTIKVGPPCGDFTLDPSFLKPAATQKPLVLISAGVGITPMMCMLKSVAAANPEQPVYFIHGARNGAEHALATELKEVASKGSNIHTHVCYSKPRADVDEKGPAYDTAGRVSLDVLRSVLPAQAADCMCYFCGPAEFMKEVKHDLLQLSVPDSQISFECFGPFDESVSAAK